MKRIATGVISVGLMLGAVACGGVDKNGTANNLIKSVETQLGTTLTATQKTCVSSLVKSYSDADLKKLDAELKTAPSVPDELETTFATKLASCVGVTGDTTGTDTSATEPTGSGTTDTTPAT